VFTAVECFDYLAQQQCPDADLQKVKWALKYLATTEQLNIAEAGAPGKFGRVPRYTFRELPTPEPEQALVSTTPARMLNKPRPTPPERLPHFVVEAPRSPVPPRINGLAMLNPNVPKLSVIEQRLEVLRGKLAAAVLAHAASDQSRTIAELRELIATWERKERLARQGEGQGGAA
jgi:hypothetical protein